jgi:hypothetical protein
VIQEAKYGKALGLRLSFDLKRELERVGKEMGHKSLAETIRVFLQKGLTAAKKAETMAGEVGK